MKRCLIDNKPINLFHANKMSDHRYICKYHYQDLGLNYKSFASKEVQHATREALITMLNFNMKFN